ncbi:hypothetical protein FHEFKHOI_00578 [Candidatus Methanoperedenaceae archaeon GB50]|nr:hypothetical protein AIOGIFDO_00577 [Candidatus Methanoperedenaceae archaeon GB37]CAD7769326.1 hypothetical protein FHEFKHOI_00578 [Candidatus Methanoperedenaceae archaeon GB50]
MGDFNRAIVNFSKAIELKPDNYRAYFCRAAALDKNGNHKTIIKKRLRIIPELLLSILILPMHTVEEVEFMVLYFMI